MEPTSVDPEGKRLDPASVALDESSRLESPASWLRSTLLGAALRRASVHPDEHSRGDPLRVLVWGIGGGCDVITSLALARTLAALLDGRPRDISASSASRREKHRRHLLCRLSDGTTVQFDVASSQSLRSLDRLQPYIDSGEAELRHFDGHCQLVPRVGSSGPVGAGARRAAKGKRRRADDDKWGDDPTVIVSRSIAALTARSAPEEGAVVLVALDKGDSASEREDKHARAAHDLLSRWDLVLAVDAGGDSVTGGVDHAAGDAASGVDMQALSVVARSGLPYQHLVVGPGCDAESAAARLGSELAARNGGWWFTPARHMDEMRLLASPLGEDRTPNVMWRAWLASASTKCPATLEVERSGRKQAIPVAWLCSTAVVRPAGLAECTPLL